MKFRVVVEFKDRTSKAYYPCKSLKAAKRMAEAVPEILAGYKILAILTERRCDVHEWASVDDDGSCMDCNDERGTPLPTPFDSKSPAMQAFLKEITGGVTDVGHCPTCMKPIRAEDFRDSLSRKEYGISGMCQACQDEVFGA